MTNFSELGLAENVLRALTTEGYVHPTPIQQQAIPPLLEGRDLLGIAQTGTGKTCAFATPLLTRLQKFPQARAAQNGAGAGARPDPRTRGADRRKLSRLWPSRRFPRRDGLRRRRLRAAAQGAARRPRRAGRHPRPPARPPVAGLAPARRHHGGRAGRGRPYARPRLSGADPQDFRQIAEDPPDPVLLGHHAERDRDARRRNAAQSGQGFGRPGHQDRGPRGAEGDPGRGRGQARRADRADEKPGFSPLHRVHPHQARRRPRRRLSRTPPDFPPTPSTATRARTSAPARSTVSRTARSAYWWPPISPRAASMSTLSAMS